MSERAVTLGVWALLALALVVLHVAAARSRGRVAGLGELAAQALAHPVGRVLLVLGWMWLGWHLFAR